MLFGTSGIRGDATKLFTDQFCFDIGRTFAKFLEKHGARGSIAIGMDPRESGQRIKEGIAAGIRHECRMVFDEGFAPSPAMNYILIADVKIAGSIMITGSHIRTDFNGVKFFAFQKEILKEHEKEIEKIYEEIKGNVKRIVIKDKRSISNKYNERMICNNGTSKRGINNSYRANRLYQKMLLNLTEHYPKWKIVLDLGNGCQSKIMPGLFEKLGLETIVINNDPRPDTFIARDTEVKEAVVDLQAKVKETGAILGIAYDGDGDRVVFVDEDGRFIPGDYSGALLAKYSDTPVVITPINVSQVIDHIGKPVIRTKVGSPYVVKAMEENGATFGFEANGGGISKDVMLSRDAGSATIKILNILNKNGKTLKTLIDTLPRFYLCRTKIECPMEIYSTILENIKAGLNGISKDENAGIHARVEEIDGLKIWKDNNSWTLLRPSSNAPEFRVFAEATTEREAMKLCEEGIGIVTLVRDSIVQQKQTITTTPMTIPMTITTTPITPTTIVTTVKDDNILIKK